MGGHCRYQISTGSLIWRRPILLDRSGSNFGWIIRPLALTSHNRAVLVQILQQLSTTDMDQKVGICCAPFHGGKVAPHFQPISTVYVSFWTDHSSTEMRVDENQLVRVETNNFMRAVRLCLIPIMGFSITLASNHYAVSLQDSTKHLPSSGTI